MILELNIPQRTKKVNIAMSQCIQTSLTLSCNDQNLILLLVKDGNDVQSTGSLRALPINVMNRLRLSKVLRLENVHETTKELLENFCSKSAVLIIVDVPPAAQDDGEQCLYFHNFCGDLSFYYNLQVHIYPYSAIFT